MQLADRLRRVQRRTEADRLRQAMSAKRGPERIEELRAAAARRDGGAAASRPAVAEDIYVKILAFSSYGFPESHAISFAYLVYASAWLKRYYPAAFTAALLRNQPMGFTAPHSLISDARTASTRACTCVDVNASDAAGHRWRKPETPAAASRRDQASASSAVRNLG